MRCLHRGVVVVVRCAVRAAATTTSASSSASCLSAATMYAVPPLHNTHELCRCFTGDTGEYRQRVRTALQQAQAAQAAPADTTTTTTTDKDDGALHNFTQRRSYDNNNNTTTTTTAQRTRELLCALAQAQVLPSMAQLRRPGHAAATAAAAVLCDVVATAHVPLALLAASHLTAASVLATHASHALHRQLSSNSSNNKDTRSYDDADVDACRVVCCVAARELVAQPAPTHGQRRGLLRSLLLHTQPTHDALDEEQKVQQQVQQLQQQQQQAQQQAQQQERVRPLQFGSVSDTCVPHTEAYYDVYAHSFVLNGAGKFAVVGAACADVALVTATMYTADESNNKNIKGNNAKTKTTTTTNDGTQRSSGGPVIVPHVCLFAVRLRERGGALCAGVRIEPLVGEHVLYEAAGVALLHLHNVTVPVHCLLRPHHVTHHGVLTMDAEDDEDGDGDNNDNKVKKSSSSSSSNNNSTSAVCVHDALRAAAQYVTRRTHAMTASLISAASSSLAQQQQQQLPLPALPVREEDVARHATTALSTRARLLAAGVCAGVLTRLMTSVTRFAARRHVAGYTGVRHDYLYMGLQHVQRQVTTAVAYGAVALLAWQQRDLRNDTAAPPLTRNSNDGNDNYAKSDDGMMLCCTYSERLRIACVLCALQEAVVQMGRVAHACMGVHASFASSGVDTAMAALHLLQDSVDQAQLLHDIAAATTAAATAASSSRHWQHTRNMSSHSPLSSLSWLLRQLVPLRADNSKTRTTTTTTSSSSSSHTAYTTRQQRRYEHRHSLLLAAEWRQLAEEHTHAISALHAAMTSAEQHTAHVNHAEAVWHAWWTLHTRDVHVCGAARVDMHLVRSVDWVQAQCRDVYVRQLLCDVALVYATARQAERMACDMPWTTTTTSSSSLSSLLPPSLSALLSALRRRRAVCAACEEHEEAVARVAVHCVALVDALAVPPSSWAPCALSSRVWRAYWSIPGTLPDDEVAAAARERHGEAKQWRRQHPQPRPRDVRTRDDDKEDDDSNSKDADDEDDDVDEALRNPLYDDMLHGLADDKATTTTAAAASHARLTERTARN